MDYYIGLDVGGSHVEGVLVSGKRRLLSRAMMRLPDRKRKDDFSDTFLEVLGILASGRKISGVGVGVPGAVRKTTMFWSPNMKYLEGTDFAKLVRKKCASRVAVDNDVNCMAYAEMSARKERNILTLTLGTGVGGGIVTDGVLYNSRPFAGEIGHMTIDPHGLECTCGGRGCFQMYVSTRGIGMLSKEIFSRALSPEELSALAKRKDGKALMLWERYGRLLGTGLSSLSWILDPEVIVIGGGIAEALPYFRKSTEEEMKKRLVSKPPKVVKGMESGNALGAALMSMRR